MRPPLVALFSYVFAQLSHCISHGFPETESVYAGGTLWQQRKEVSGVRSQTQAGFEALLMGLQAASELGLPCIEAQGPHQIQDMVRLWLHCHYPLLYQLAQIWLPIDSNRH